MTWYRALKTFPYFNNSGQKITVNKGQLIDIVVRQDAQRLLGQKKITPRRFSSQSEFSYSQAAPHLEPTKRIGIFLKTTSYYSGGRIHLYQFAWNLANAGAEVYLITEGIPIWRTDFPHLKNLHILQLGTDKIPPDLDVVVTDGKHKIGQKGADYKAKNPQVQFVVWSFETPNWVAQFDAGYSRRIPNQKVLFKKADALIANSKESAKWLREFTKCNKPLYHIEPAVNPTDTPLPLYTDRKFAVAASRAAMHKHGNLIMNAVRNVKEPFDLVLFGSIGGHGRSTKNHRIILARDLTEPMKLAHMQAAHMVLAPSNFEGFGMVPAESLSMGTPCVVYDLPVLRQNYGNRLIYVKRGDQEAFIKKVKEVASKPKRDMGKHKSWCRKTYSLEAQGKKIENVPYFSFKKPHVTAHMICYWGFIPEALESVYGHVNRIRIAFGPTKLARTLIKEDGSLEKIKAFPDPDKKIEIEVREEWQDKLEMRQWCTGGIVGNYHLLLDGDEIWVGLDKWIKAGIKYGSPRWINLWHGGKFWICDSQKGGTAPYGRRWGIPLEPYGSTCPHYRWSWWRQSYKYTRHTAVKAANGSNIFNLKLTQDAALKVPDCAIYHLGHSLSREVMEAKHQFYLERDGKDEGRRRRRKCWQNFKGKAGQSADGMIRKVNWKLPPIVQRALANLNAEDG